VILRKNLNIRNGAFGIQANLNLKDDLKNVWKNIHKKRIQFGSSRSKE